MTVSREDLEKQALQEICACLYYDLADSIDAADDDELRAIIEHTNVCELCDE
jgi:hypothetical protein